MTQQSPNPQPDDVGRHATKNKRDRPYLIESRWNPDHQISRLFSLERRKWRTEKRYRTADERDRALEQLSRKYSFMEYRPKDPE